MTTNHETVAEAALTALIGLKHIIETAESNASGNPEWDYVSKRTRPAWQCIPHIHAGPNDNCGRCGLNFRDGIHVRSTEDWARPAQLGIGGRR